MERISLTESAVEPRWAAQHEATGVEDLPSREQVEDRVRGATTPLLQRIEHDVADVLRRSQHPLVVEWLNECTRLAREELKRRWEHENEREPIKMIELTPTKADLAFREEVARIHTRGGCGTPAHLRGVPEAAPDRCSWDGCTAIPTTSIGLRGTVAAGNPELRLGDGLVIPSSDDFIDMGGRSFAEDLDKSMDRLRQMADAWPRQTKALVHPEILERMNADIERAGNRMGKSLAHESAHRSSSYGVGRSLPHYRYDGPKSETELRARARKKAQEDARAAKKAAHKRAKLARRKNR